MALVRGLNFVVSMRKCEARRPAKRIFQKADYFGDVSSAGGRNVRYILKMDSVGLAGKIYVECSLTQ